MNVSVVKLLFGFPHQKYAAVKLVSRPNLWKNRANSQENVGRLCLNCDNQIQELLTMLIQICYENAKGAGYYDYYEAKRF